ncbi:MAG TPA: hypothetical protein VGM17_17480 [Rhizomicrobium sp.]|jgi:hypothetical protein
MNTTTKMIFAAALLSAGLIAPAMADSDTWIPLGREHFHGKFDHEASFPGWAGKHIDMIALRTDDVASCTKVRVTFRNGHTDDLNTGDLNRMTPGRTYRLDLPGEERNVARIAIACHSLVDRGVTVQVFARK